MAARGLITLPDTAADFDDPDDEPIAIKGEPLSETVIRERGEMAHYFFVTSALVKRHVIETGSRWVKSRVRAKAVHTLYIARITAIEVTSLAEGLVVEDPNTHP